MLHAAGVPVPTRVFAQGWITKNGKKLSKTTGNVIDPVALVERYGPDAVRYFLLREGAFGQDWDFTDAAFVGRYNADLANDLGNLVSRALTMVARYCDGKVPPRSAPAERPAAVASPSSTRSVERPRTAWPQGARPLRGARLRGALARSGAGSAQLNQAIVQVAPWEWRRTRRAAASSTPSCTGCSRASGSWPCSSRR